MTKMNQRVEKLLSNMNNLHYDVFVIASKENIKYLFGHSFSTGKRISAAIINSKGETHFLLNHIFSNQLETTSEMNIQYYQDGDNPVEKIVNLIPFNSSVAIDQALNIQTYYEIMNNRSDIKLQLSDCIERLREIKDEEEINLLRQSSRISDAVMHQIVQLLQHPTTERTIGQTIGNFFEGYGITDLTFNPIVACGENTVNPHHVPGDRFIRDNEPLLIDMGCIYKGYCSDMTRMFGMSGLHEQFLSYYEYLQEAQSSVLEIIKPGIELREIDIFLRNYLKKRNLDTHFIHGIGHGIGLEGHEYPYIHSQNKETVKEGMVVTIGPGIYLEGKYGVRIEDVICVTKSGVENLNNSTKELVLLDYQSIL